MHQSLFGFELLSRSRQIDATFGSPINASLSANPIITGATLDEAKDIVTWECLPSEGASTGITITYDIFHGAWLPGTHGNGSTSNVGGQSTAMVGSTTPARVWLATSTGEIFQESTTSYLDDTAWVGIVQESPWIHGGLVGLQMAVRAILMAQSLSPHDLTVQVGYDNATSYTDTFAWAAAEIAAFTTNREMLECAFTRPECTSFKFKVTDATPTGGPAVGTGQGPLLIGLQTDGGDQGILVPLPVENRK